MTVSESVAGLVAERDRCRAARGRVWSLPGEPLVGVVSAGECERWRVLGRWVAHLDREIARIAGATR